MEKAQEPCAICFEKMHDAAEWPAGCGHCFCAKCLLACLVRSPKCPLCRAPAAGTNPVGPAYTGPYDDESGRQILLYVDGVPQIGYMHNLPFAYDAIPEAVYADDTDYTDGYARSSTIGMREDWQQRVELYTQLINMGFDQARVERALVSHGTVQGAVHSLLDD